jgi:hypothetical protein
MVLSFCRGPGSIHALNDEDFVALKFYQPKMQSYIRSRQFRKRSSKIGCYRNEAV